MIRFSFSALPLLVLCGAAMPSSAYAQEAAAKAKVEELLEKSANEFLAAIDDVNEEQWNFKGTGIRHSIGEEAEHICFAEQELQRVIINALKVPADPKRAAELEGKEEKVRTLLLDAEKGPENFQARGRLNSKLEVLEYFPMAHKKLLQLLAGAKDLSTHIYKHPGKAYGDLTALQWFYYVAYHKERHVKQIEAIKARADYPGRMRTAESQATTGKTAPPQVARADGTPHDR
jgi:DinB superfamily